MQVHPNSSFDCLFNPLVLLDREVLNLNRKQLSVHLEHRTVPIVVGEGFCVQGGTCYY